MTNELISLFIQVPLVAAFVVFALLLVKGQREDRKADQERLLEHELGLQKSTHQFIADQNERWQEILTTERDRRKEAMDQGLREVSIVGEAITKLADALALQTEAFSRHDQAAIDRHERVIGELRRTGQN